MEHTLRRSSVQLKRSCFEQDSPSTRLSDDARKILQLLASSGENPFHGGVIIKSTLLQVVILVGESKEMQGLWHVKRDADESKMGCTLRVYTNVNFSKKTMFKGLL